MGESVLYQIQIGIPLMIYKNNPYITGYEMSSPKK